MSRIAIELTVVVDCTVPVTDKNVNTITETLETEIQRHLTYMVVSPFTNVTAAVRSAWITQIRNAFAGEK